MKAFTTTLVASLLCTLSMIKAIPFNPSTFKPEPAIPCQTKMVVKFKYSVAYGGGNIEDMKAVMNKACKLNTNCERYASDYEDCQRPSDCWRSCGGTVTTLLNNDTLKVFNVKDVKNNNYDYYYNFNLYNEYNKCGHIFDISGVNSHKGDCYN